MAFCETCGKEFKTEQGLAGHQQLKHARQRSAERWDEGSVSAGQHSAERSLSARPTAGERLERIEAALEQLLNPAAEHSDQSSCSGCQEMRQETLAQGRVAGINEIAEIPGVKDAVAFASSTERWNEEHPDHAIDENWASVPGVRELVEGSRPNLITITRAEPAVDNPLIRIVTTPEGDLRRREMIKVEVKRNVNDMTKAAVAREVGQIINEINQNGKRNSA